MAFGADSTCDDQRTDFQEMAMQARDVRSRFAEFEDRRFGRPWSAAEVMLGLVGDVGDLAKLVQGRAGVRPTEDLDAKLAHELADCLWAVMTLADLHAVNLEVAFNTTVTELHRWLDAKAGEDEVPD